MPPCLYKFMPLSRYVYEAIALGRAWFSAPALLNDPYDGQLPIDTSVAGNSEAFSLAIEMVEMAAGWKGIHLLLWAHYTDSHKGIALRYKINAPSTYSDDHLIEIEPVVYVDAIPTLHVRDLLNDFPGTLRTRFTTKGKVWSYEHEWRAISTEAGCLLATPGIVDQIIFGHRMPPASRQALRKIAGKMVSYLEAHPKNDDFAVEIVPV